MYGCQRFTALWKRHQRGLPLTLGFSKKEALVHVWEWRMCVFVCAQCPRAPGVLTHLPFTSLQVEQSRVKAVKMSKDQVTLLSLCSSSLTQKHNTHITERAGGPWSMKWGVRAWGQSDGCGEEGSGVIDERDQEVMQLVLQVTAGMWAEIRMRRTMSLLNDTEGNKKRRSHGGERGNESRI